ncbi:uncharacterized protein K02A2.6-like [Trichonephila clavipes]|nr:uncharacterized protein K02A2.6-like [Trichonephila clavipes]
MSYSLPNTSLVSQLTRSPSKRACLGYDKKTTKSAIDELTQQLVQMWQEIPQENLDIALTDDEPIFHKSRRLSFAERDIVDAQVDEWVENGSVEPCSSPYASQVVVVKERWEIKKLH